MNIPNPLTPSAAGRTRGRPAFAPLARQVLLAAGAAAFALTVGCAGNSVTATPPDTIKYTLDNTENFAVADAALHRQVSCTGLQEHALADGRLEVVANLKNRDNRSLKIEASCEFKDAQDIPTQDTPWQRLVLAANSTEAVRFTASSAAAAKYTVRVRRLL